MPPAWTLYSSWSTHILCPGSFENCRVYCAPATPCGNTTPGCGEPNRYPGSRTRKLGPPEWGQFLSHDEHLVGPVVSEEKVEISSNGKTIIRTLDVTPPGGSPDIITATSRRISGGPGLSGTWKETAIKTSRDTGVLAIQLNGDSIDFKETDNDKPITCKLDGSQTTISGKQTMTVKQDGPRTLKVTYSNDGKVVRENTLVLSSDGKTVEETDITPAPWPSTMSVTFHRS